MARRFEGQSVSNVMRVVQTEGTHVARQAQASEMRAEGFEEYYLDPVGDDRTCDRCREAARESRRGPFRFDEAETGTNFPPLHPRCRCRVSPAVEDWSAWLRRRREERREAPDGTGDETIAKRFGGEQTRRKEDPGRRGKPVNPALFNSLRNRAERHGHKVLVGGDDVIRHLDSVGAAASTIGDVVMFREDVTTSEALEEFFHLDQNDRGDYYDLDDSIEGWLRREIDAKEYLLSVTNRYSIPPEEVESTKRHLEDYRAQLAERLSARE